MSHLPDNFANGTKRFKALAVSFPAMCGPRCPMVTSNTWVPAYANTQASKKCLTALLSEPQSTLTT
jgi:hypothetical protein